MKTTPTPSSPFPSLNPIIIKTLFVALTLMLLGGCTKTEEEKRLSKFRKSIQYKTYRFASETATQRVLTEYNKTVNRPIDVSLAHATVGIAWFMAQKSEYSFIEADLAKTSGTAETKMTAMGLQSIALFKLKCPALARATFSELKKSVALQHKHGIPLADIDHKMMLISLMAVSLYHGDTDLALLGADALGSSREFDYLAPLVRAIAETKDGHSHEAMGRLRELSRKETFSEHKRKLLSESADLIQNCPEHERDGEALVDRLVLQLVKGVVDDLFSEESQKNLLKKITSFVEQFTKEKAAQPSPAAASSDDSEAPKD